ncbi:hypothetical protein ACFQ1L_12325 [Phytohabitans flavus]
MHEIDARESGPPPQARLGAGQLQPWGQESGLLGALSGRQYGEHDYDFP